MKYLLQLTAVEILTLEQLSANHRYRDVRVRASGLLMLSSGLTVSRVAGKLNVSVQSLYNWIRLWQAIGVCGLLGGHKGGRPKVLPETMLVAALALGMSDFLTLRQIAQRLEVQYGMPLPCRLETLGAALRRGGWSARRSRDLASY